MHASNLLIILEDVIQRNAYEPVINHEGNIMYYKGARRFPEIHLKTQLMFFNELGLDISDRLIFDVIVEYTHRDVIFGMESEQHIQELEERLNRFSELFWIAICGL